MKVKISVAACAVLALFAAQANAAETVKLEGVEVNSVGDNISESGISEGILNKGVASGPLAGKKVLDMPYQVNTMSIEAMNHQGVAGFEDAVKYFPSAQIQARGGVEVGRTAFTRSLLRPYLCICLRGFRYKTVLQARFTADKIRRVSLTTPENARCRFQTRFGLIIRVGRISA